MKRGKYVTMSMAKKAAIVKLVESGRSRADVAKEFHISKQTLSDYIKNKQKILEAAEKSTGSRQKNVSQGTYPKLEEALLVWLKSTVASKVPVSGGLLKQKAEMMALQMNIEGFKVSDGWLRNFKKRSDLSLKKLCGESAAVDLSVVANYRSEKLQSLLQEYSPDDTFNCDETGLFFKLMPEKTLAFAGDPCHGGKHSKERVTVLIGSNMSGTEKLPMLVIGKSKAPRCFKGVKSLPVSYEANKKAWVTQKIFESYVRRLDRKFDLEGRKIVLFVDNCAAHGHINNLKAVRVEFLPPNTTSVLQPMDQGVIRTLKVNYRSRLLSRAVVCLDSGKAYSVDLLGALSMLADAWKSMTSTTLRNCFRHAGFVLNGESAALDEDSVVDQVSESEQLIDDLRTAGVEIPSDVSFSEFACVDSELELCAGLTDEEIIRQVLAESESDDDDDDLPATTQPTQAELMQALATLSSAYSDTTTLAEMRADVLARKRNMVQKKINHFFRPPAQ